jgi:hypothetical protein
MVEQTAATLIAAGHRAADRHRVSRRRVLERAADQRDPRARDRRARSDQERRAREASQALTTPRRGSQTNREDPRQRAPAERSTGADNRSSSRYSHTPSSCVASIDSSASDSPPAKPDGVSSPPPTTSSSSGALAWPPKQPDTATSPPRRSHSHNKLRKPAETPRTLRRQPLLRGLSYSGGGIRTRDLRVMSPLEPVRLVRPDAEKWP